MKKKLENLTALVLEHRQHKKRGRYPAIVWETIASLRKDHTAEEISQGTGIHPSQIYRRRDYSLPKKQNRALFHEVKLIAPPTAEVKAVAVELRRGDGAELRFRINATPQELSNLFAEFLR